MFGNKGKINTPRFPMLHHEESPRKPQYNIEKNPFLDKSSPFFFTPFFSKKFQTPLHFHQF